MKKVLLVVGLVLVPMLAFAEDVVQVPVPKFSLAVFIQQVLTNGGGVLLGFLLSKVPVVGAYAQKIIDVLIGNQKH